MSEWSTGREFGRTIGEGALPNMVNPIRIKRFPKAGPCQARAEVSIGTGRTHRVEFIWALSEKETEIKIDAAIRKLIASHKRFVRILELSIKKDEKSIARDRALLARYEVDVAEVEEAFAAKRGPRKSGKEKR